MKNLTPERLEAALEKLRHMDPTDKMLNEARVAMAKSNGFKRLVNSYLIYGIEAFAVAPELFLDSVVAMSLELGLLMADSAEDEKARAKDIEELERLFGSKPASEWTKGE